VRENRTHGSEGGEGKPFPTPIGLGDGDGIEKHVIPTKAGIQVMLAAIFSKVAFSQLFKLSSYQFFLILD
jgi:hypothetical protein